MMIPIGNLNLNQINMLAEIRQIRKTKKDFRNFGIVISIFLMIIAIILWFNENLFFQKIIYLSVFFLLFGIIYPRLLKPIYLAWMTFAVILGWFMTRVILILLYYLLITPLGFIMRLFGKDFLDTLINNKKSYWNQRDHLKEQSQDYTKQY